jgi:hypothetical protein
MDVYLEFNDEGQLIYMRGMCKAKDFKRGAEWLLKSN